MDQLYSNTSQSPNQRWRDSATKGALRLNRRSVLIVDDEEDGREALAMWLRFMGYEVHVAGDGDAALKMAQRYQPGLIFLDINMPRRSGYSICRELRRLPAVDHARIYAISALSGAQHEAQCRASGFTAQFTKPLDPAVLEELL